MMAMKQDRQALIQEMLKTQPNDPFLIYAAALEYKKSGDIEKSIDLMRKLYIEQPEYLATYYQLGKLLEDTNELEEAIKIYKAGREVAKAQKDLKTLSELSEALMILDEDDGEVW
jgi:tetratricopeptide (TPR) repeat protein